jgi:O-antigen/teichoic acid export membrane protein
MSPSTNTKDKMLRGVGWMAAYKVTDRLLSLVSMLVLARLLVPADFGLVVLATATIGFLEVLGAVGLDTALIRQSDATSRHYDAVWTFKLLFACVVAVVTACLAPIAAAIYDEPRLMPIMLVLAGARVVSGFESTGPLAYRKELDFRREVRFMLAKRVVSSLLITIPLAFVLQSYWALVIGTAAGAVVAVVLSYIVHPYRPRFSIERLAELMHFSKWLYITSLAEFLHGRFSDFVIGLWGGVTSVGAFTVAREVSRIPSSEVVAPIHRAVFPGYVKLAADRAQLKRAYVRVTSVLLLLVIPAGTGLCLLAEPAVAILFGERWMAAVPIVRLLAINGVVNVLYSTGHYVNLAVGMSRSTSIVLWVSLALSVPMILYLVPEHGATGAAFALLAAAVLVVPLNFFLLAGAIAIRTRDVAGMMWRPLAGTAAMSVIVLWLDGSMAWAQDLPSQLARAALLVSTGAATYVVTVAAAWSLRRDPDAAEAWLLDNARRAVRTRVARFHA